MRLALLILAVAVSQAACRYTDAPPTWSDTYSAKGVLYIPYAELEEPFFAWYDAPNSRSRIDYYGDMAKTYQLGNVKPYGTSLKVVPITTEKEANQKHCLQVNGTSDTAILPQTILPDLTGFTYIGQELLDGVATDKWAMTQTIGQKTNKYAMWLKWNVDPADSTKKIAVPVKYSMKGYNSLLGSHYDHYYLDYGAYDTSAIDADIFAVDQSTCSAFPGPGDRHIYTFNPMAEFVHPATTTHVDFEFDKFQRKHGKQYLGEKEAEQRLNNFRHNLRVIHAVNRQNRGYTLGVNHLADRTDLEMKALRGRRYSGVYNGGAAFPHYNGLQTAALPDQFDWRLLGAVTPVKDQSVCGSCWSFGTIGAVEGAYFLKNGGQLVRLSQQALIDCSWGYGNNGCDGGEDFRSYQWIQKHGGVPTEESYGPYLGQDGYCHADEAEKVANISGWVNVTSGSEDALKMAIFKHGPVSVAIDASHRTFSFYSNGVYYEPKCGNGIDQLDHAVLAVGYGQLNGKDYWLIKNSWSNYWGNDGYVLMAAKDNNCGVMTTPTYVEM